MKLKLGFLFLMFILLSANIMPVGASGTDRVNVNTLTANSGRVNYFFNGIKFFDDEWWCDVETEGDNLNVRKTPPSGAIIGKLEPGSRIRVIDGWTEISAKVNRKTITGWVADSFLFEGEVVTEGDNLNVRQVPPSGTVIGKLPNGTTVNILDSWSRISWNGNGWVATRFLSNCAYE